jgi:very-short-patch-repair endonuclease
VTYDNNFYNKNLKQYARELRTESVSRAERILWKSTLSRKQTGQRFLRQRPIDFFIVDFFCPDLRLIIEIDGNSHFTKPEYDARRQQHLLSLGYQILRFEEGAVIHQLDEVVKQINHAIFCLTNGK